MENNRFNFLAHPMASIDKMVRALMPLTSLLTVGVVGYISYVYLLTYIPLLYLYVEHGLHGYSNITVTLRAIFFIIWPVMIFWTLGAIVCGDAGVIDKKFIEKLYSENNIE